MTKRKNIQVIDGALNCGYEIFSTTVKDFFLIFPDPGQDIEFSDQFFARVGNEVAERVTTQLWKSRMDKKAIKGIHGTLFYGLEKKKQFYPTRRESEMVANPENAR